MLPNGETRHPPPPTSSAAAAAAPSSILRVLAAEEMAPFTTKQSLEEIEQLQNLLD